MLENSKGCLLLFGLFVLSAGNVNAAKVECSFLPETNISTSGEWLATDMDFMKLIELFTTAGKRRERSIRCLQISTYRLNLPPSSLLK